MVKDQCQRSNDKTARRLGSLNILSIIDMFLKSFCCVILSFHLNGFIFCVLLYKIRFQQVNASILK